LAFSITCLAQGSSNAPSLSVIVSRMTMMNEARYAALHSYQGVRTYNVSYKGFPKDLSAKVVVKLEFTAPDEKRFSVVSQEGSKFLINRVVGKALQSEKEASTPDFRKRSALNDSNYDFQFAGRDADAGRPCYVLQVKPKRPDKYLYDGRICVDAVDFAVVRIEAKPAKNPSFWITGAHIESRSQKLGEFWLPASTRSRSHVRLGGNAELDIDYGEYKITSAATVNSGPVSAGTP
jgi:hypothetical protein